MMSGSFSHLQVAELPTDPRTEGHEAAVRVLARLTLCHDATEQAELLHQAMLDLIDVPLGWNDLEPTCERLAGFAQVVAPLLSAASSIKSYELCTPATHFFVETVWRSS